MGRIAILPDAVADQIAAGEVVERPASVVKELVENALDAGATRIDIELEAGGRARATVADNGCGMDRDDAVMAFDRHATSKLRQAADLVGVPTYGFRGEAVPAIASVSRFELETRPGDPTGDEPVGATRVVVNGGRILAVEDTVRDTGTTVTVRRLFFNAPARRKFLRSQAAETRAVVQAVTVLALGRLDVAFRLTSDGRTLLDAPRVETAAERIASLYGAELAASLIPVDHIEGPVTIGGLIQRPADARPSGRRVHLFVNGRPFRDPFLVRAAESGYRATIHPGDRPSLILTIGVPGEAVDVNVHPAKLEVRFRDRRLVEHAVTEAVRRALGGLAAAAVVGMGTSAGAPGPSGEVGAAELPLMESVPQAGPAPAGPSASHPAAWRGDSYPLLQVFETYILLETPEGLAIVDQHSAHERVLYERTMAVLESGLVEAQRLLLPVTLDVNVEERRAIEEHVDVLTRIGFEVEPFGGRSVVLHAVPNPHPRFDARRCFEEVAADLARDRFGGWANRLERFAATYACRAAVKGGQRLDDREMRALVQALFACTLPPHDVHGRPTVVQLPKHELERRFGRR